MEYKNPPPTNITLPHLWDEDEEELKCRKCKRILKNRYWALCWDCYIGSIKVTEKGEEVPHPLCHKKPEPVKVKLKTVKGTIKRG